MCTDNRSADLQITIYKKIQTDYQNKSLQHAIAIFYEPDDKQQMLITTFSPMIR